MGQSIKSDLVLHKMVFDKLSFSRKGFKNNSPFSFLFTIKYGKTSNDKDVVTLILNGKKDGEYEVELSLTGFFSFNKESKLSESDRQKIMEVNTVTLLMPYIRTELTILTSQPDVEPVTLPPINIMKLLEDTKNQ